MPAPKRKSKTDDGNFAPPRHEDCWAKTTKNNQPGINVIEHCLNVGFVAEAILQILPPRLKSSMRTQTAPLLAALHDIGKVSPGFQSKCTSWLVKNGYGQRALREGWAISCESDHAKIGQHTVQ